MQETTKLVLEFINKVGEQLTTMGTQLFTIYVKQAYVEGITAFVIAFIMLITIIICLRYLFINMKNLKQREQEKSKYLEEKMKEWDDTKGKSHFYSAYDRSRYRDKLEENYNKENWVFTATLILGVVAIVIFLYQIPISIKHILNPEFYAIQDIIRMIK